MSATVQFLICLHTHCLLCYIFSFTNKSRYSNDLPTWNKALIYDPSTYLYYQSAQYFNYSVPALQNLAVNLLLEPTGSIDPASGKISLTLEVKPMYDFPDTVAFSPGINADGPLANQSTNFFKITWTIVCNGNSKSCSSDRPCEIVMDCHNPIHSIDGWSSRYV